MGGASAWSSTASSTSSRRRSSPARPPTGRGVLFTAVVQGRVTEFLDIEGIIRSADPDFFEPQQPVAAEA